VITLAGVAVFLTVFLLGGGSRAARLRRLDVSTQPAGRSRRWQLLVTPAAVAALVCAGAVLAGGSGAAICFAVGLPLATAFRVWRRQRARRGAARNAVEVATACRLLAGLLRLGHVPAAALRVAAGDCPLLAEVVAVQQVGGAVAPALRRLGARPGAGGLADLGAAWEVSERTGASLGATLEALAERLIAAGAVTDVVSAELAAPRATGRLLAVLPVAGLALGYAMGGDPVAFLTGSAAGQISLALGVALGCAGVLWTERIADGGDG
jgi:tight adherence protein B